MDGSRFDSLTQRLFAARSRRSILHGLLGGGLALAVARNGKGLAAPEGKVPVCHRTGDELEPYTLISVPENALKAHLDHGDFAAFDCDGEWSCEECPDERDPLPLFCDSEDVCPTGATQFCPGGPLDTTSSDQAMAACEACFGVGECVHFTGDCSGAGWLAGFDPESEPPLGSPIFGYENSDCGFNPQPAGRVYFGGASDPASDYGNWGTSAC